MDDPLRVISETVGVFLRREALDCGYNDKTIAQAVRAKRWHRLRQGAYCFLDVWSLSTPEQRHLILARAVLRTTPGRVALSHTSALVAHGIATWGADLSRVHVTRLDTGAGRRQRDVEHHVGLVCESDVMVVDGLTVMIPERAVIEASTMLTLEAALVSADSALHLGACTPDQLRRLFGRLHHWPGSRRIHVVLHHMDGRAESPGETRARILFWRQGLPMPELQFHVYDGDVLVAITDFVWHQQKTFGEFDGKVKYGRWLRPDETPGDAVFREKRREDLVRDITGYGCGRLVWPELDTPAQTGARFARLLGRAA